ncbi:Uncharacterised protein [Pragia fontium]|uniref:hypothetical protein n=1 Tax=Pragia fontium TaxID=82985 RepID=UPI0006499B41|nr:hypothetical protein [Pragia fontium]AKJ40899.1 hypothetical protein QQ39_01395 [Pragia fontium]SUB81089.1 Uncharacterised protein [Pragia fontium]
MKIGSVMMALLCVVALISIEDSLADDDLSRRDPFLSPESTGCLKAIDDEGSIVLGWQLRGVIGRALEMRGWIQTPTGSWIKAIPQMALPLTYWQLENIQQGTATFSVNDSVVDACRNQDVIELKLRNK